MLALFRNGSALIQWFIILLLLLIPLLLIPGTDNCTGTAPLTLCPLLSGTGITYTIVAALLSLLPVVAGSLLLQSARLISFSSFLPSLVVVFVLVVLRPYGLNPDESIVLFLLFLGLKQLLGRLERGEGLQEIFLSSFMFSLITLMQEGTLLIVLIPIAYLVTFRSYQWRQWAALPMGLIVPHAFALTYYFWFDRLPELQLHYSNLLTIAPDPAMLVKGWLLIATPLSVLAIMVALLSNLRHLTERKIYVRAQISLLSLVLVVMVAISILGRDDLLFLVLLPLAWLLSLRMLDTRSKRFPSMLTLLLFLAYLGSIIYHWLERAQV